MTYSDVGGCKEQIEKLREVVETPLLHVSKAVVFKLVSLIHSQLYMYIVLSNIFLRGTVTSICIVLGSWQFPGESV